MSSSRSTTIEVINNTSNQLNRTDYPLPKGSWKIFPPEKIPPSSVGIWMGHVLGRDSLGQSQTLDKKV